jgi:hypothetical protein
MGKRCGTALLDLLLNGLKTGSGATGPANKIVACSAEPTSYTEANATYMLANDALVSGDFTLANGDGAGTTPRKATVGAQSGVTVTNSGTATHVALIDTVNSLLLEVTTCTSQALTAGNTVNFPSFKIEVGAPT